MRRPKTSCSRPSKPTTRSFNKPLDLVWGDRLRTNEIIASAVSKSLSPAQRLGLLLILRESDRPQARTVLPSFLSDPDPNIRFAAIQWVGEQRLTEFRSNLQAGLARAAETRTLFEATLGRD